MKKVLSIFLAVLMTLACAVPAFAADDTVNVSFAAPSDSLLVDEDGTLPYSYVVSREGNVSFYLDENGVYTFDGTYFRPYYRLTQSDLEKYPERYTPVPMSNGPVARDSVVTFRVLTNRVYNNATVNVFVNGTRVEINDYGEYSIIADRDLFISIAEREEQTGKEVLLRNHYSVTWEAEDGYKIRTLADENYKLIYYGGDFYFRVKVLKGYTGSGMSVRVLRDIAGLGNFPEEMGTALAFLGQAETLSSYGTDSEGYRLYKISNIDSDCKIYVMGVKKENTAGILAKLKRILRMILGLLGIKLPEEVSLLQDHRVTVDASGATNITYSVVCSGAVNVESGSFLVLDGDTATVKIRAATPDSVVVKWTPNNEDGTKYNATWVPAYDYSTGDTYFEAVFNVENITADTVITIESR